MKTKQIKMNSWMILSLAVLAAFIPYSGKTQHKAWLTGKTNIIWEREMKLGNHIIPLADNGSFNYKITLKNPDSFTLKHQNKQVELFITAGDSLHIDLTGESLVISGASAKINNSFLAHQKTVLNNLTYVDDNNKVLFSFPFTRFEHKVDSLKIVEENSLKSFVKLNQELSSQFILKLTNEIIYRNKFYKLLYPHNFNRHTHQRPQVPRAYFAQLSKNSFDHPELLESSPFVRFVNLYLDIQSLGKYKFQNMNTSPVEKINSRYHAIKDLPADQKVKDFFFGQHFQKAIGNYSARDLKKSVGLFKEDCLNDSIKKQIVALYNKSVKQRNMPSAIKIYKQVGSIELEAHIFNPKSSGKTGGHPAYIFFHGGSWAIGKPEWGYENCLKYAEKGMVAISIDYRLQDVHGTFISDAVNDALSAVAWVREHAAELGVNSDKIIVAGFSSGAHLAACTAMISGSKYFAVNRNSKPNALILESAAYTIENKGAVSPKIPTASYSPLDNVKDGLPPMLLVHGEFDDIVNHSEFEQFVRKMKHTDNKIEFNSLKSGHFFYNPDIIRTINELTDEFMLKYNFVEK